jgi:hypothetical protein
MLAVAATLPFVMGGTTSTGLARWMLGCAVLAGIGFWLQKGSAVLGRVKPEPRMVMVARTALSSRCSAALVEVDGRALLIVHGDGFAQIREASGARRKVLPDEAPR